MQTDPTADKSSLIRPYSLGVAAANLEFGQKELEVTPVENLAQLDGEVTDTQTDVESTGVDKDGNTYSTSQKASNSIKAMWLPLDAYRAFPGLIRRGERVMIWRVGDTDKYYWTEMGLDDKTRRRDIMTFLIPNSPKEGEDSRTPDTAYFIEVNTVDKHITIQTNKNDGEQFAYLFQLNPGGNSATLCDDVGNYIQLDSLLQKIILKNQMNSEIWIEKNKGAFRTQEHILFETKTLDIKTTDLNVTTSNYTEKSSNHSIKTSSYTVKASSISWTGSSYAIKSGSLTHNGINVGATHYHIGNMGRPTSPPI
jgi:hypothetical protein